MVLAKSAAAIRINFIGFPSLVITDLIIRVGIAKYNGDPETMKGPRGPSLNGRFLNYLGLIRRPCHERLYGLQHSNQLALMMRASLAEYAVEIGAGCLDGHTVASGGFRNAEAVCQISCQSGFGCRKVEYDSDMLFKALANATGDLRNHDRGASFCGQTVGMGIPIWGNGQSKPGWAWNIGGRRYQQRTSKAWQDTVGQRARCLDQTSKASCNGRVCRADHTSLQPERPIRARNDLLGRLIHLKYMSVTVHDHQTERHVGE